MNEPTLPINTVSADRGSAEDGQRPQTRRPIRPSLQSDASTEWLNEQEVAARQFHRLSLINDDRLQRPGPDFLPALLDPYRRSSRIRFDFPLFLFPPESIRNGEYCVSLSDLILRVVSEFAPDPEDERILKDNLIRLEKYVRDVLSDEVNLTDAREILTSACDAMLADLELKQSAANALRAALDKVVNALPVGGMLLRYDHDASTMLFLHIARQIALTRRDALRQELRTLRSKLVERIRIDRVKDAESRTPDRIDKSVGSIGHKYLDSENLSKMIGQQRGTEPMPDERRQRIEQVIATVEEYLAHEDVPLCTVIGAGNLPDAFSSGDINWQHESGDICNAATETFDQQAAGFSHLVAAMRVARLELADSYDSSRHDELLRGFDWRSFSDDERRAMPPILAIASSRAVADSGIISLSRMLRSGRGIHLHVAVAPESDPAANDGAKSTDGYRFEIGFLGISHRDAFIHQSTVTRPGHFAGGLVRGFDSPCAALHLVCEVQPVDENASEHLARWMVESAAVESRAHPLFLYDPGAGESWARRFDLSDNPGPDAPWPGDEFTIQESDGTAQTLAVQFTYAEFALLFEDWRSHFRVITPECNDEHLIPVGEYFALDADDAQDRIPFVYAVDSDGTLHRLVISRQLLAHCEDRLSYWHTLQELAGIGNEHVDRSVRAERERLTIEFETELETVKAQLQADLERVRIDTATEAFQKLAQTLLETDISAMASTLASATGAVPAASSRTVPPAETVDDSKEAAEPESAAAEAPDAPDVDEDEDEATEPWIDSVLCTTCNDCMQINAQVFVYNSKKQATIGNPRAGTFEEIVKAAEKCPARCIHPGQPLNPDEPNLEDLKKRAKKFN